MTPHYTTPLVYEDFYFLYFKFIFFISLFGKLDMRIRYGYAVFVKGVFDFLLGLEKHGIIILLLHPDKHRNLDPAVEVV